MFHVPLQKNHVCFPSATLFSVASQPCLTSRAAVLLKPTPKMSRFVHNRVFHSAEIMFFCPAATVLLNPPQQCLFSCRNRLYIPPRPGFTSRLSLAFQNPASTAFIILPQPCFFIVPQPRFFIVPQPCFFIPPQPCFFVPPQPCFFIPPHPCFSSRRYHASFHASRPASRTCMLTKQF